jgi:hypothetical protein
MSLKPDMKYNGTVGPGSHLYESQTGSLGYQVILDCPDGSTTFTIWLTQKTRERAKKYFELLGVDPELLKDPGHLEYQLGMDIEGREVSFGTKDEEYNGKRSLKVVWIGKKSAPNLSRSAARFFGATTTGGETADEEIPF